MHTSESQQNAPSKLACCRVRTSATDLELYGPLVKPDHIADVLLLHSLVEYQRSCLCFATAEVLVDAKPRCCDSFYAEVSFGAVKYIILALPRSRYLVFSPVVMAL